ncbi:Purine catabolism regulatory protein [Moorella thermoacetica]|uniref:Purine catabolism regulatory protein n=5 Tax=Neomoorella thermoacetica TaxID=1525 RepID=A0AAC9HJM1_NEOTH|nr:PucR family transcriptional regulator [Moorella thermoacetica]AOQ25090.1 Purine catabolism regulatory protein [Moorella thermoacetica]TYL15379.1 Purine catabolism regulatory protein [Moorella thermoacetica]GAF25348.1 regulator of polyketide synthase expression [Moorella thermoacetica Y72]
MLIMGITVREALRLPQLEGAVLVGGEQGLDRIINSVNIMEVPDIGNYIKPAELLLTTAYPIKDDIRALENLIPELNKCGLAALAIKPERYIREIPEIMIKQANKYKFPLIKLPNSASFNEIINPILTEILNRQAAILQRNEQLSKALTGIVLYGGGLAEIARTLAGLLGLPVSIHDPAFRKIASWLAPRDFGADNNRALAELVNDSKQLAEACKCGREQLVFNCAGGLYAICRPVTVAEEIYAYLFIWGPQKPISEREITGIEQAVTVIALEISKQRAVFDVESRFKSSFIEYLVDGKITSKEDAIILAERFGWEIANGFTVMLFECDDLQSLYDQEPVFARKKRLKIMEIVNTAVVSLSPGSAVVERGRRLMVLHRPLPGKDIKQLRRNSETLARSCCEELAKRLDTRILVGISRFIADPMKIAEGINQSHQALEIGRRAYERGQVFHFDDLGVYRILLTSDAAEMQRFYDDILGQLVSYDEENKAGLITTLEMLFANDMNLQKTADALFIHYNTLRYRINRIQQITGLDLKSPDDRLSLQLALKILHMKGN